MRSLRGEIGLRRVIQVHETPSFLPEELARFFPVVHQQLAAASKLNFAVQEYAFRRHSETQLDHADVAAAMRSLSLACQRVLHICGVFGAAEIGRETIYSSLGPGVLFAAAAIDGNGSGEAAVIDALQSVDKLRRWSIATHENSLGRANARPKGLGRPADADLARFMDRVAWVYEGLNGRKALIGSNEAIEPFGPFLELLVFSHARLVDLGLKRAILPASIVKAWRRFELEGHK